MSDERTDVAQSGFVEFNYQKSPAYRSVHIDGALASATPRGLLALNVYNERVVIPRIIRKEILAQDSEHVTLGDDEVVNSLAGMTRQLEFTMFLTWLTAVELRDMLTRLIDAVGAQSDSEGGEGDTK